jgi:Amt family ammonium transporter
MSSDSERGRARRWAIGGWPLLCAAPAPAQETLSGGDTAWILVATALVLFMMIPGLAMFYGGLVRTKNVLSLFMQCFAITAVVSLIWVAFGYSLSFSSAGMVEGAHGIHAFIGGFDKLFLRGITPDSVRGTIPEALFVMFQMTFAVITPGLIIGAFAERMKFSAVVVFTAIWVTLVYLPVCHMVWGGPGSFFGDMGTIDFAGGIVVHLTAAAAALAAAVVIGPRKGYGKLPMMPHNLTMTMGGTAMLWVGWFGFNGGSALQASGQAAMTVLVTQLSPCVAGIVWAVIEYIRNGKPSALGFATGAIAGLAAITPASGSVGPFGAIVIGVVSGAFCYWASTWLKHRLGYDDALDVVGVHGGGGLTGTLLVGVLGTGALGGWESEMNVLRQLGVQSLACLFTIVYSLVLSYGILKVVDALLGLRVSPEAEEEGLDIREHGEVGYDL